MLFRFVDLSSGQLIQTLDLYKMYQNAEVIIDDSQISLTRGKFCYSRTPFDEIKEFRIVSGLRSKHAGIGLLLSMLLIVIGVIYITPLFIAAVEGSLQPNIGPGFGDRAVGTLILSMITLVLFGLWGLWLFTRRGSRFYFRHVDKRYFFSCNKQDTDLIINILNKHDVKYDKV